MSLSQINVIFLSSRLIIWGNIWLSFCYFYRCNIRLILGYWDCVFFVLPSDNQTSSSRIFLVIMHRCMQVIETMCYHLWRWIASISRSSTLVPPQWCVANYPVLQNVPPHTVIAPYQSETLVFTPPLSSCFLPS